MPNMAVASAYLCGALKPADRLSQAELRVLPGVLKPAGLPVNEFSSFWVGCVPQLLPSFQGQFVGRSPPLNMDLFALKRKKESV